MGNKQYKVNKCYGRLRWDMLINIPGDPETLVHQMGNLTISLIGLVISPCDGRILTTRVRPGKVSVIRPATHVASGLLS